MTKQERVWWQIRAASEPLAAREIGDLVGLPAHKIKHALRGLRRWGAVAVHGTKGPAVAYSVPAGLSYPCPGSGRDPASLRCLQPWTHKPKPKKQEVQPHELDRCWAAFSAMKTAL